MVKTSAKSPTHAVILHISDLHFGWDGDDENERANRHLALEGLLDLVDGLKDDWRPNCISISGDIGWKGQAGDYKAARDWISRLLTTLELTPEALFICPGNHDANRVFAKRNARPATPEEADSVLGVPLPDNYLKPFQAFSDFCAGLSIPPFRLGEYDSFLVGCRPFRGVLFVAYNSAWCSKDDYDKQKLWLGLPQMRYMESKGQLASPQRLHEWPPTIALFHHPRDHFHEEELQATGTRPNTFDYMARRCHLFFTGHTHGEIREADKFAGGAWHLSSGATYAGASHFNAFRIVQVRDNRFLYRTFEFDPRSADNAWRSEHRARTLAFKSQAGSGPRPKSPRALRKGSRGHSRPAPPPKAGTDASSMVTASRSTSTAKADESPLLRPAKLADDSAAWNKTADVAARGFTWDVFISYSRADGDIAARIAQALKDCGVRVWIDKEQIVPGDMFVRKMEEGLEASAAVAILISPDAVKSGWVEEEYMRAISLTKRAANPARLIPVLVQAASVPGFLANRSWVDFQDESKFEENIELLAKGIRRNDTEKPAPGSGSKPVAWLSQISFLWFFPEGMLRDLYAHLILRTGAKGAAAKAEQAGLIRVTEVEGLELIGASPERIRELRSYIADEAEQASKLLPLVREWIEEVYLFFNFVKVGFGRALLIRDLLSLTRCLPREEENEQEECEEVCRVARPFLPLIIEENHLRVGVEISKTLLEVASFPQTEDNLIYARLLLLIGEAGQAADIFDVYVGENLFEESGLSKGERLSFGIDWAKATKDAGRAGSRHGDLMRGYQQMLDLLSEMKNEGGDPDELLRLEADVRSNRATQIAQYGQAEEWDDALDDFAAASNAYLFLGDDERLLASQANFVSHSLDRPGAETTPADLKALLDTLEKLDEAVSGRAPSEHLFFFFYQKGRLLKRLYPQEPYRAAEMYELASRVAQKAGLNHRHPIARRWALLLREKASELSEGDYLQGLRESAAELRRHLEDSWAAHALGDALLDIAEVLRKRQEMEGAWTNAVESFGVEVRHYDHGTSAPRLLKVLKFMNRLSVGDEARDGFLSANAELLRKLARIPAYDSIQWDTLMKKIEG